MEDEINDYEEKVDVNSQDKKQVIGYIGPSASGKTIYRTLYSILIEGGVECYNKLYIDLQQEHISGLDLDVAVEMEKDDVVKVEGMTNTKRVTPNTIRFNAPNGKEFDATLLDFPGEMASLYTKKEECATYVKKCNSFVLFAPFFTYLPENWCDSSSFSDIKNEANRTELDFEYKDARAELSAWISLLKGIKFDQKPIIVFALGWFSSNFEKYCTDAMPKSVFKALSKISSCLDIIDIPELKSTSQTSTLAGVQKLLDYGQWCIALKNIDLLIQNLFRITQYELIKNDKEKYSKYAKMIDYLTKSNKFSSSFIAFNVLKDEPIFNKNIMYQKTEPRGLQLPLIQFYMLSLRRRGIRLCNSSSTFALCAQMSN